MNRYLKHMHGKPTHERRQHAMKIAAVLTALVFVGWVTTLGLQLGSSNNAPTQVAGSDAASQTAAAVQSSGYQTGSGNQLIVSTTTGY
jgi:hypothetical protein